MADQLGRSVGDMYKGAWGPSLMQVGIFALYTFALGVFKPSHVPGVPREARTLEGWALWSKCLRGIIPSAVLIFAVLGSMGGLPGIDTAIATPTEAGAMGAFGAFVLAAIGTPLALSMIVSAICSKTEVATTPEGCAIAHTSGTNSILRLVASSIKPAMPRLRLAKRVKISSP